MGLKQGISTLLVVAALAMPMNAALCEENVYAGQTVAIEETQAQFIDMFKTEYEITDATYDNAVAYQYASDDGKTVKWYWSYLPEIDGLKRTAAKPTMINGEWTEDDTCDIKEPHVHGYYNLVEGLIMPFDSEKPEITAFGYQWIKTKLVIKIDPETMEILHKFKLYRLIDNLIFIQDNLDYVKDNNFYGVIYLEPKKLGEDTIELDGVAFTGNVPHYDEAMNGYLMSYDFAFYQEEPKTEEQLHFTVKSVNSKEKSK